MSNWNQIGFNEETGAIEGYPLRSDEVVFLTSYGFCSGWFENEVDHDDPTNNVFGFVEEDGVISYHEAENILAWVYSSDLKEEALS